MLRELLYRRPESLVGTRLSEAALLKTDAFSHRRRTALVVDDDVDIRPLIESVLARYDFVIDDVGDGASALALLRSRGYDLLILDLGMPEVDGFEVLQVIKRTQTLRHIPVLVLTADGSDEALARSFGYGASDLVTKPFNPNELGMRAYRLVQP